MAILVGVTMGHLRGEPGTSNFANRLTSVPWIGIPISSTATGCAYEGLLKVSSLIWIPGLIYEPILFVLVAYKAWGPKDRSLTIPLVTRIARDRCVLAISRKMHLSLDSLSLMYFAVYVPRTSPRHISDVD